MSYGNETVLQRHNFYQNSCTVSIYIYIVVPSSQTLLPTSYTSLALRYKIRTLLGLCKFLNCLIFVLTES